MHQNYYLLQQFSSYRGLVHAISSRSAGDMEFIYGEPKTAVYRSRLAEGLSIPPERCVKMEQVHGTTIAFVGPEDAAPIDSVKSVAGVDGLLTNEREVFLFARTADCLPVLYYDPKERVVGLAHAGWRGVVGKLPALMVASMTAHYGCNPENIMVGIGPCLDKSANVLPRPIIQEQLPEWREFLHQEDLLIRIDLVGFTVKMLHQVGIVPANIEVGGICTAQQPEEFFSAKNGDMGRFATIIGLR